MSTDYPCRLCGATTSVRFNKTVLGRHSIAFLECPECDSMQTERPYWLDESYADGRRFLDINAASRAVALQQMLFFVHRAFGLPATARLLDWGAGDGLLVRLLRDVGIAAYYDDPLATNQYANGFEAADDDDDFDIVTAFEVWEHLSEPAEELAIALAKQPKIYIASTEIYTRQGESWPYLNLLTGRHVFFYSEKAVAYIAKRHGYSYHIAAGKRVLLYKDVFSAKQVSAAKRILDDRRPRLRNTRFALTRKRSLAARDREDMERRVRSELGVDAP